MLFETIFDTLIELALFWAPRPIRIGCTILLLGIVLGLLARAVWAHFQ